MHGNSDNTMTFYRDKLGHNCKNYIFKMLIKNLKTKNSISDETLFQRGKGNRDFQTSKRLSSFAASQPAVKEILKRIYSG